MRSKEDEEEEALIFREFLLSFNNYRVTCQYQYPLQLLITIYKRLIGKCACASYNSENKSLSCHKTLAQENVFSLKICFHLVYIAPMFYYYQYSENTILVIVVAGIFKNKPQTLYYFPGI
jgi:hypothetical protein